MKVFFHSADLDGQCSAAILRRFFPEAQLIGINYGQPFPWDDIDPNEPVWMVDFSLQPFEDMIRLANLATLIWIDHHKTAIDESLSRHINLAIPGLRADGVAACELVWKYIQNTVMRDKKEKEALPFAVYLLGSYDVWRNKDEAFWSDEVLPFQYGMRMEDTHPENDDLWSVLLRDINGEEDTVETEETAFEIAQICGTGERIIEYIKQSDAKYMRAAAHTVMLDGLKCLAINRLLANSLVFESMWDPNKYDAMLAYGFRGKQWTVSLYSDRDDIDVGDVAKRRGGGGHKGAAGFQCATPPFFPRVPMSEAINL